MGKIFYIMGKSSTGKDTIYKRVLDTLTLNQGALAPKTVVIYTTRPMRPGETNGVEYFFATEEELQALETEAEREIDEAVEYAKAAPLPTLESALENVFWEG